MKPTIMLLPLVSVVLSACSPDIPENSARQCYNPKLYKLGNTITYANYTDNGFVSESTLTVVKASPEDKNLTTYKVVKQDAKTADSLSEKKQLISTQSVKPTDDKLGFYHVSDQNSVAKESGGEYQFIKTFSPGLPEYFGFDKPGMERSWTVTGAIKSYETDKKGEVDLKNQSKVTLRFIAMEKISTSSGTYQTCHLRYTRTVDPGNGDYLKVTIADERWYLKGLGVPLRIKRVVHYFNKDIPITQELVSASIDSQTFSQSK